MSNENESAPRSAASWSREMSSSGEFRRQTSVFRDWVTADGSSGFAAESGRYHLYASLACPWASRAVLYRKLMGLEHAIGLTIVDPYRDDDGWAFRPGDALPPGEADPLHGWRFLSEAYVASDPGFDGRVTVPVLWDTKTGRIVNNESSEIIRMLGSAFDAIAEHPERDYYPAELRDEIDALNDWIYPTVNNGVYRSGFATSQEAYDEAVVELFASLDRLDGILAERRYLTGDRITEADWRLLMTLVRFDPVYVSHFKCDLRRIVDYEHLWPYVRDLYQQPGVAETVSFDHIKRHYFTTHPGINPTRIIPQGPIIDWDEPHGRG